MLCHRLPLNCGQLHTTEPALEHEQFAVIKLATRVGRPAAQGPQKCSNQATETSTCDECAAASNTDKQIATGHVSQYSGQRDLPSHSGLRAKKAPSLGTTTSK